MKATTPSLKPYYWFLSAVAVVSLIALAASYLIRKGPAHDAGVSQDIRAIASQIDTYYLSQKRLPASLAAANLARKDLRDRAARYEYQVLSDTSYKLCATFETSQDPGTTPVTAPETGMMTPDPERHGAGYQCFTYAEMPVMTPYPIK